MANAQFKNVNKRIHERKKNQRKRFKGQKVRPGKQYADFIESSEEEGSGKEEAGANTDDESDGEAPGNFYVKFKE